MSSGCRCRRADEDWRESRRREGGATARGEMPQLINQCPGAIETNKEDGERRREECDRGT